MQIEFGIAEKEDFAELRYEFKKLSADPDSCKLQKIRQSKLRRTSLPVAQYGVCEILR